MELENLIKQQAHREGYVQGLHDVLKNMQPFEDISPIKIATVLERLMDTKIKEIEAENELLTNMLNTERFKELLHDESHHV